MTDDDSKAASNQAASGEQLDCAKSSEIWGWARASGAGEGGGTAGRIIGHHNTYIDVAAGGSPDEAIQGQGEGKSHKREREEWFEAANRESNHQMARCERKEGARRI